MDDLNVLLNELYAFAVNEPAITVGGLVVLLAILFSGVWR